MQIQRRGSALRVRLLSDASVENSQFVKKGIRANTLKLSKFHMNHFSEQWPLWGGVKYHSCRNTFKVAVRLASWVPIYWLYLIRPIAIRSSYYHLGAAEAYLKRSMAYSARSIEEVPWSPLV